METNRQKKIAGVIQEDLANVLRKDAQEKMHGVIISVTKVKVTPDLNEAKAYLSIFPSDKKDELFESILSNTHQIKHELAQLTRNQLRKMPDLTFYIDDSLDYIDNIDIALKGKDNPINDPDQLSKKKKK
ncbi:MAG: ribosome-binding factor A [Bacteroidota bacterium]